MTENESKMIAIPQVVYYCRKCRFVAYPDFDVFEEKWHRKEGHYCGGDWVPWME